VLVRDPVAARVRACPHTPHTHEATHPTTHKRTLVMGMHRCMRAQRPHATRPAAAGDGRGVGDGGTRAAGAGRGGPVKAQSRHLLWVGGWRPTMSSRGSMRILLQP
jgi:hypothetical protein